MPRPEHLLVLLVLCGGGAAQLDLPPLYESDVRANQRDRVVVRPVKEDQQPDDDKDHGLLGFSSVDVPALLQEIDELGNQQCTSNVLAQWNYETDVNEVTQITAVGFFASDIEMIFSKN